MSTIRKTVLCPVRGCHHSVGAEASARRFPGRAERREYVEETTRRLLETHYAARHPGMTPDPALAEVAA